MYETVQSSQDCTSLSDLDDARLAQLGASNPAAFAELYRRHVRRVFHYLLTYSENAEDAADLTQMVFLKALEALPSYRDRGSPFAAWLVRIARNLATDTYRHRHRTVPWEYIPASQQPFASDDPTLGPLERETINQLRMHVAGLSPDRRELVYLRFAGELSIAEIAEVVGRRPGTVQRQLHRVLRSLKEQYDATQD